MRLRETAPWLAVFAVILAGVLVWNGLWGILFEHNDQYRIRTLEIVPGALTTREEIVSVAGLREGDGLFAKGADEIRRSLLVLDRIDRVDASLRPPDALRVAVVDRVPVVRLRGKGQPNLYADANAAVFVLTPEKSAHLGPLPVVENGGDIALKIDRDITVGVFQDDERFRDIAFRVKKRDGIFGICSSSAKVGPSVSFGKSSISTVFSDDVILADACATALGNMIKGQEMSSALEDIGKRDGVEGCVSISDGLMAMFGNVPELIRAEQKDVTASSIIF